MGKKDAFSTAQEMLEEAAPYIHLKAYYKTCYIHKKNKDTVEIEGKVFSSHILRINLDEVERVFPYVVTIGPALEKKIRQSGDILKQYYLENIGDMALYTGTMHLEKHLKGEYGLGKLSSMSPGSLPEWPITEQAPLFSLLGNTTDQIGVRLTDSMLMLPRKSISGIIYPTEVSFFSCQLCRRNPCQSRKAPYDKKMEKKYGLTKGT